MKLSLLTAAAGIASCAKAPSTAPGLTGPVDALVFGGYDNADIAKKFEEKYGVNVNFTVFSSNEDAYTKIKASSPATWDLVQADSYFFQKYYEEKIIEPFSYSELQSSKDLYDEFKNIKIWQANGGLLAYPSLWAPWPIIYNPDKVEKPTSWEAMWDEKYKGHVSMIDRPVEPIVITGIMLGVKDPFSMTTEELKMCEDKLIEQKPLIRQYFRDTDQLVNLLQSGEVWISMGEGPGIASQVRGTGVPCEAVTPKEGTIGWVDGTAIMTGAKDRAAGIKWIDTQYSWEGYMVLSTYMPYGIPNKKAVEELIKSGKSDFVKSTMSDQPQAMETMYHYKSPSDPKAYQDTWNRVLSA